MAQLSEVQENRARQLHGESFVFDFSPHAEPFLLTPKQREVMLRSLERGQPLRSTLSAMANARIRELEYDSSALAEIQEVWKRSGVNGVQVTLGGMELAIAEWEGVVADLARCYARESVSATCPYALPQRSWKAANEMVSWACCSASRTACRSEET